jgi:hypothetical protein
VLGYILGVFSQTHLVTLFVFGGFQRLNFSPVAFLVALLTATLQCADMGLDLTVPSCQGKEYF